MNEQQFLELSDRERDGFVRVHVYKKPPKVVEYWISNCDLDRENDENYVPRYTTTWEGMGKGIEHANENGWSIELYVEANQISAVYLRRMKEGFYLEREVVENENIFLAFWIAYCKALGVLE